MMTRKPTATVAAANASSLSCSRSSPRDRRYRTIRLAALPRMHNGKNTIVTCRNERAGTPNRFRRSGNPASARFPALNRIAADDRISPAAVTHANHRQRRDGRCPSGNSKRVNVPMSPTGGTQVQPVDESTQSAAGRGATATPYVP